MRLQPLRDLVVVKLQEAVKQTESGIVIPDNFAGKTDRGTIVATGPGKTDQYGTLIPIRIQVGDEVLFAKNSGQTIKVDGEEYLMLSEDQLFARLT